MLEIDDGTLIIGKGADIKVLASLKNYGTLYVLGNLNLLYCGEVVNKGTIQAIGSALSEGSLTVIAAVAGIAVGIGGTLLVTKKKKTAPAADNSKNA